MTKAFLGVDVGSVSTNIVAVSPDDQILSQQYIRTNGQPLECIKNGIKLLQNQNPNIEILGVGTTGSGRQLAGVILGADIVKNEITAHATAVTHYYPEVKTIFEIGGQDSKVILLQDQMVVDFAMNTVCAAGTGSFLDHQAERLKIPIEQFGDMALSSNENIRIAGRCTVFAESDMIAKQQFGFSKADIIKGLCEALIRNYLTNLCRGKNLEPPFVFQGGVAANKGIVAALEKELKHEVIIPKYFNVMGAIGAALIAKDLMVKTNYQTKFSGFDTADLQFVPKTFNCEGCPNACEVIEVDLEGEPIARWGDKCGKWANAIAGGSTHSHHENTAQVSA
ncbi:MAG TPA: 2-hydroxyglutaryl-CoA dehydratase [Firmicutes bacterium]|jgi:predicted CoA-substrate-specific enzyme activase|nr:2-hydroxyglutaryl-CoA dehydratase [Bacillota bacterium]